MCTPVRLLLTLVGVIVAATLHAVAWAQSSAVPVARVALAVGQAQRIDVRGQAQPIVLGSELAEQDRIVTGKDAMLMLVFSDHARVAVRPDTELVIRRYRIDPAGVDTRIHIDLIRGAMRQISGQGAQLQPERYRLNTPIAVIGVRGTDFLAKVGDSSVETYVHEGMIVVLPVSEAEGTVSAMATLSASNAAQYLVVRPGGQIERRHVSPAEIEALFGIRVSVTGQPAAAEPSARAPQTAALDTRRVDSGLDVADNQTPSVAEVLATSREIRPPLAVPPMPKQLVWGRFSGADDLPWRLTLEYAAAAAGRHPTVGELGQFALFRDDPRASLDRNLRGQVDFALAAADALLIQATQASPVRISAPALSVDFDRMRFATQMTLSADGQPQQTLSANGSVNSDGILLSLGPQQRVAGALTANGREAGYFFNLQAPAGLYQGMTLWSAK
jgi:hypothetical protein